jgi:hypothetical protein
MWGVVGVSNSAAPVNHDQPASSVNPIAERIDGGLGGVHRKKEIVLCPGLCQMSGEISPPCGPVEYV